MFSADVVVAGAGVSGLLIANALAAECSVLIIEQCDHVPRNKYWLTDEKALADNPHLEGCVERRYEFLDFVAYDGLRARIRGRYCLWNTEKLIRFLEDELAYHGVRVLTDHKLYSFSSNSSGIAIRANAKTIQARLLIDCMGFGSPLVGAKNIATITGYYVLHGCEVGLKADLPPTALDNVLIGRNPAFFELFPTSRSTAHAAIILPSHQYTPSRSLKGELNFILGRSHYSENITWEPKAAQQRSYFGIIPVGCLREAALDRIVFFGEAGQVNPAASATGLARMLRVYRELASSISQCLKKDSLGRQALLRAIPPSMSRMNRAFQETLFERLLSFNSDDFRRLVQDLKTYPDGIINDLMFADFDFRAGQTLRMAMDALIRPRSVLGANVLKAVARFLRR